MERHHVKELCSNYANRCIDSTIEYVPVIVFLRNNKLDNVYRDYDLENVLSKIIAFSATQGSGSLNKERKILLVLDGLDEYSADTNVLEKLITAIAKHYVGNYPNLKVIITTRLKSELPEKLKIERKNYLRLLPFTDDQVNKILEYCNIELRYQDLVDLGLDKQEITKPLLVWMLSSILPSIQKDLKTLSTKAQEKSLLTSNMAKSLIYLYFIHHVLEGKHIKSNGRNTDSTSKSYYIAEKQANRRIALLKQVYKDTLTEEHIKEEGQDNKDSLEKIVKLEQILTSYSI